MASHRFTSALSALAGEREGVIGREQLLAKGFDDDEISDALTRSILVAVLPGVYLVGRVDLTQLALRHAATIHASGKLIGRAAAEHRGLLDERVGVATVATPRRGMARSVKTLVPMRGSEKPGLVSVRPTTVFEPVDVDGVPTASVPRMLVDLAASDGRGRLERAWKQADYHRLLDLTAVDAELRRGRRKGAPLVRALFLKHPGRFGVVAHFESPAEVDFLQLVVDAGLPAPETNVPMRLGGRRYVADFLYREWGLVVELDDPSHRRPLARERDAVRDVDFFIAGLDVVRFETQTVAADPTHAMDRLAAIIDRQRRRAA